MSDLSQTKADLRRQVREQLRSVSTTDLQLWSDRLITHLQSWESLWHRPGTVSIFGGLRNEPDLLTTLMPWLLARGWRVALFAVDGVQLQAFEITAISELQRGPLGVWEPHVSPTRAIEASALDLILVPGLAFGRNDGSRLGRGGGFYDRYLARPELTATKLGVAFDLQIHDEIPHESHDLRVDGLISESMIQRFNERLSNF